MKQRTRSGKSRVRTNDQQVRERRTSVALSLESPRNTMTIESHSPHSHCTSTSTDKRMTRTVSVLEASRHRLSIRKSASFPMQQTAPKPFLACCADITRYSRDWNAEFQLAWEMEDNTVAQAEERMAALRRVEKEFVEEAAHTVKQIVTLDDDGPRELPKFLQCYRVDNIFFRVLPDSRSGRNYVASLRAVLQSRTRLLTVPLSCMFFYRGMPVLAQALIPMPFQPTRLYGADSTNDKEVEAEILHMADALNIPFPDGTLEVYEGLDGRFYLTNSNSTLTPLFVDDTIMKRHEMLRLCGFVTDGHEDTLSVLDNVEVTNSIVRTCMDSECRSIAERLKKLCEVLHSFGINLCLLKQVLCKVATCERYDPSVVTRVTQVVAIEMIARSVKQEFYLEVQGKRVAYDDDVLTATLSKHVGEVFAELDLFRSRFLEVVAKKYGIVDEDEGLIDVLTDIRMRVRGDILGRVCMLLGVVIEKSSKNATVMKWHPHVNAHVFPKLIDPQYVRGLSETYRTVVTHDSHRYAFCLPLRWKVACWEGQYEEALDLVHETVRAQSKRHGDRAIVPLYSRRNVCEVCFATMHKQYVDDGRNLSFEMMRGFEELTCDVTQGRLHIEYGFWILRVASLYQVDDVVAYRSLVEEAAEHFYNAIAKLPGYLKSEHGAWLHLKPYKGLLMCKQLLPSCSVSTRELVEHSIELSTIGWASDFFMYYLWDLSLQLESEGRYEDAIKVLLTAIAISKKKPTRCPDLPPLMMDGAHIYRSWDKEKYAEHCITLMREASDKAVELFGVESRVYAVVQNNRGAIEIDLARYGDATGSLRRAGEAFSKASVPKDDPDYVAYLANLAFLKQCLSEQQVEYRGFLQRYPFLATRGKEFPFDEVRPLEDEVFVGLARQRALLTSKDERCKQLEKAMRERLWELHRNIQEGDVLKRYPFLSSEFHGIRTASLRLEDDAIFMEMIGLIRKSGGGARQKGVEIALAEYVAKKAKDTALERAFLSRHEQDFNDQYGGYVNLMLPIPWLYVVEDVRFNALNDRLQRCLKSHSPLQTVEGIKRELADCVREIERETFEIRSEFSRWLPLSKLYTVSVSDLVGDQHLCDLVRVRRLRAAQGDASVVVLDGLIQEKLNAAWERSSLVRFCLAVDDEELHRQFPFLPPMPHNQRLSTLSLHEDPGFASLSLQLKRNSTDSRLQADMNVAVSAIAARRRDDKELKKLNCDVESFVSRKIEVEYIPNMQDDYYVALLRLKKSEEDRNGENSPEVFGLVHQMEQRVLQMNAWARKVRAHKYRQRLRLEAKYPFISRRYYGYTLELLNVEDDGEFMDIAAKRQELLVSPDCTPEMIEKINARANRRVHDICHSYVSKMEEHVKKYPFISSKVEGVDAVLLHLEENETFSKKAKYYAGLSVSNPKENELRCNRLIREMKNHALATAREINVRLWREAIESEDLRERYAFLPEEPARGIMLADVRPTQQSEFRTLSNELDELRRDPVGNKAAICAAEEKLCAVVTRLAEESLAATAAIREEHPFLPRRVLGVPLSELPLRDDEEFVALKVEGGSGLESKLICRAIQLGIKRHLNDTQLADADDQVLSQNPFLVYTTRKCFPLRHLRLSNDDAYTDLLREYRSVVQQPLVNEDSAASIRFLMACRADLMALNDIEEFKIIERAFDMLKPLSLEDIRHLRDQHDIFNHSKNTSGDVSPLFLQSVQKILSDSREDREAKLRGVDALRKAYPMLGRNIDASILNNPQIAKLVSDHDELMDDQDAVEEVLKKLEEELAHTTMGIDSNTPTRHGDSSSPQTNISSRVEEPVDYLKEDITNDPYYRQLSQQYNDIKKKNRKDELPILNRLTTQIRKREEQIRRDAEKQVAYEKRIKKRLQEKYPSLSKKQQQNMEILMKLENDDEINKLQKQLKSNKKANKKNKAAIETKLNKRVQLIAQVLCAEEEALRAAHPFLGSTVRGVPLRELCLKADPEFARLSAQYVQSASSCDADARADQERALREAADRVARDVRAAKRLRGARAEDLRERYAFLPEEPARGIMLADVRPTQQSEFRTLSNELDELRRDPVGNKAAICAAEEKLCAVVTRLAEESLAATAAIREEHPFLPRRVLGVPLSELPLRDDAAMRELARRRSAQLSASPGPGDAKAAEDAMLQRAEELARTVMAAKREREDANELVRAQNPFLVYDDRKCVPLAVIPLSSDNAYQELYGGHLSALEDAEANAPRLAELEEALRARADELALAACASAALLDECPFLGLSDAAKVGEELLKDAEFQQLRARREELLRDPVKNVEALREIERAMNARGEAVAQRLRAEEGGDDEELCEEEAKEASARGARSSPRSPACPEAAGDHTVLYPFLPDVVDGVAQDELCLDGDPYFLELLTRYRELVPGDGAPSLPLEKQLYERLLRRAGQLAADTKKARAAEERAAAHASSTYPYLEPWSMGVPLSALPVEEDAAFCEMALKREKELAKAPGDVNQDLVREMDAALQERARSIAQVLCAEEEALRAAHPFLGSTVRGVPLRELCLKADPEFARLSAQYVQSASSCDADARADQERALREAADRVARDVRAAKRLRGARAEDLRERYAFLPEEPARGIMLADVRPTQQSEFRTLSNELDELRRDPVGNKAAICAAEEKLCAVVTRLAEESLAATAAIREEHPFLPRRVLGVPLSELPLRDDAAMRELARRRSAQLSASPGPGDAKAAEDAMLQRAEELARTVMAAKREREDANELVRAQNPFLVYDDRKCVPLAVIPLSSDNAYQELYGGHLSALEDAEANAPRLAELEEALRARADELALAACASAALLDECPFLGLSDAAKVGEELLKDAEFQQLRARREELLRDPVKNVEALREIERAMNARGEAVAQRLRAEEGGDDEELCEEEAKEASARGARSSPRSPACPEAAGDHTVLYPFLPDVVDGVAQDELCLDGDPYFLELLTRYRELVPGDGAPSLPLEKQLYERLLRRAGQLAADTKKARAAEERAAAHASSTYPYLEPWSMGVPLSALPVEEDAAFCEMALKREKELAKAPGDVNQDLVREMDAALQERARSIAQVLCAEEEALRAAHPFLGSTVRGVPLRELCLKADPEFARLSAQYVQSASSCDADARADQERALREAADRVARDVRAAKRLRGARAEDLRERYAFLPEEPARGIMLADVRPTQQSEFRTLSNELDELRRDPVGNKAAICAAEEKLCAVVTRLAEESLAATAAIREEHPFLPRRVLGVPLSELPLRDDAAMRELARRRSAQLSASPGPGDAKAAEDAMLQRAEELARTVMAAKREREDANELVRAQNPFLVYDDRKCVPLAVIPLSSDNAYQELYGGHLSALEDAEANAPRLAELEEALRARADELALAACASAALLDECPFLGLSDAAKVGEELLKDAEFQQLRARREELLRDPVKNVEALREIERAMNARGEAVAQRLRAEEGGDDEELCEEEAKEASARGARSSPRSPACPEAAGDHTVLYPFLPDVVDGVAQDELCLDGDPYFLELLTRYRELVPGDGAPSLPLEKQLYERLLRRAGQLAADTKKARAAEERAAAHASSTYPYLEPWSMGVPLSALPVEEDAAFCEMALKREKELAKAPGDVNQDLVREMDAALQERARSIAQVLCAEEEALRAAHPFLGSTVRGVPLRELCLKADPEFARLSAQYVQSASSCDADARADQERALREAADRVARDVRAAKRLRGARAEDLRERYAFLPEEPARGIMLADVRPTQQSEFRTLSNELDELRRDPVGNKAAICAAEEKLCAVVTRLAEESLAATAAIREEHPFLPRRVLGVPLSELPLRDDAAMRELARRRSAQLSASPGPGDAKAAEDAMLQRAEELARTVMAAKREREDANELVRAQNPFLVYDDRKCVPLAVIPLSSDNAYQELYGGHLSALEDAEANAPRLAELEEALRARADELALAACASAALLDECPFLGLSDAAKVGEELLKDAEFQQLRARREELLRDPVKNVEALREIERAMNARGEAVAQRLRAEEGGDDEELCEEEAKEASARGARSSPRSPACPEAAGDHTVLYPFLPDVVDGVAQDELCLDGDPYFLELLTRYRELVPGDGAPSLPLEKQLYERLLRRAGQLAADTKKARAAEERAAAHASSTYPYLEPWSMGVPLSALPVEEDAAFCEMALKREKELAKAPGDVNQDLVREMDAALQERARSIAQVLCAEEEALRAAHPFLGSTVRGVPLRELCLKADPEFARLSAQYVQSASSCDADARADQERALREAADRVARDVRAAKRLRGARAEDLRERYAFLPEEPARGIMLADVRPTQQSEFRTLSNELDELRRDPVGNKAAICAAEEKLCAVVTRLAEESLAATAAIREEHPFLPRRVLGVPLSELPLRDDAAMRELARRRSAQLSASPGPGDAKAAEDAMLQRAEELARTVMAAKREREDANELVRAQNPFLVYDDRKCVPLAVIPLSSDNAYQELYGGHLSALEDAEANAPRLAELEEALRARADELALAACASAALLDECPFLGLSDAAKVGEELLKDAEFQQLRARREELLRDPVKNVEALREIERAMNARGEAVAQRLRAEEGGDDEELCEEEAKEASARGARSSPRSPACPEAAGDHTVLYPFLPDVVDGVAQDELCLDGDPYFLELLTRYRELVPGDGAPSLPLEKQLYERLLRRAGQLAADTKKARAAEERAAAHASSTYPYLEPWSMGVPLSALPVEEDAAFCEMALKREKELAKAPGDVNQDLVREMDAALQERARSIAQVLCAEEEALRAAHPFLGSTVRGVPLRELCLKADPEFARLSAQYVQSASSCDADARADQERALREAADRVARDVRAAKRLRGARAEDLRERYAFLPEEPARGIMLADVRPTQQSEFRTLSNELDELRRDPVGNKAAICAAEEKLCAVVTRLAEESLAATAAIREEHPFLPRRVLGVPLSELPLRDDAAMRELARRRSAQLSASPGPGDAKAAEDAMLQRAEELARTVMAAKREREDANELVRAQNPFLVYDDRKCVPLAVIPLSSDNAYQELYGGHLSALEDAEANAPRLAELEEALRARADELALAACASAALLDECPFLGLSDAAKVGEELLKDAEFQQLRARREELLRDPVKNVEALREIERAMNARGEAVAQRLRAEEGGDDEELCEEEAKEASARGARSSPRSPACPEAAGDHTVLYPFLPDVVDGVAQDELCLDGDPYFLELLTRYRELVPGDGAPSLPLEKQLYERLLRRAGQLAADTKKARAAEERAAAHASSTYPYLEPWSMGVPLSALPVEEDAAFCEMALKREKELAKAPGDVNQDLVREMDAALQERARSIAQVLCAEEEALRAAHPFLGSTVRGVPLRELCLKADPEFARLSAQYVQSASSCDADARADQERALREAADRVARDVRAAKRLRGARAEDLRERYAFLPEEPARGIMLADVRPTQQSEFRTLSNELDELRRDPVGNKAAICAAEEKLCAVVTRLAEESLAATAAIREEHPFLPRRVLGVPLSELPLRDDAAMRELARRRSAQLSASPGPGDAKAAEDAMLQRAEELARTVMAAKREREDANELVRAQNPFLVYDDRKCVPLAVIPLSSDNAYQELYGGHLSALEDAEANAPRLAELEEALRARADELALAACASAALLDECPFLGLSDAAKVGEELLKDAEFQQLRARREELLRDPVKNVEALREIERAMNARGEAVAQRLRAEEGGDDEELCEEEAKEASARGARSSPRSPACPEAAGDHTVLYPFLPDVVDGVAQDELCLDGDPYFLELLTRYRELVPGDGAPSLPLEKQLYERLLRRAGQLAADTKKARAAEERAAAHASSTYPYLEPWSMGVPLSALPVEEDAAFCEMALKREKELAKAPGDVNQDLVREMDAALQERARSIAQVLCAEEEALRAAHPFLGSTVRGVPLRELCLKADPEFARLSAQYVQSASSCDADARADQERALREAADRVARDVRAAKRLRGARAEDLRERYAFLPEEPARGIMLADVRPTQQSEFRTLSNELDELRRDPVGNKAAICAAEEKLCAVVTRLAEESLAATAAIREEHPFLPRRVLGVPLSELPLRDDAAMRELARRRSAQLSASPGPGDAKAAEDAMLQRAEELARTVMAAKREREDANELVRAQNPFLVYDDRKCVPLAVIPLSSDNAYQELYGGHLSALEDAEANAPRLAELEEALRARADELALAACASAALLDECPFLGLSDAAKVGEELLKDAEFQQLRARREELLRDPVKNVEALREIERAMNARGEAVAQRLRAEEGGDDEELCEEEAKEASARGARSSPRSPACPEAAGDHTVLYPFLPDVVDGVAQDELCLDGDPYFLELLTRYRELVPGDGAPSLPLEKQLYERLLRRAGQLAADTKKARAAEERAAAHASSTYPYLEPWSMGVPLSALPVEEDAAFCEMALKREKELAKAPGDVNQDLVREMDAALQERARSIAQVLCAEEEALRAAHPFLGSTVRGVPLRELCLKADPEFARLSAQYVQSASSCDADARADQERALREAADRVARDVRAAKRLRGARAEDLRERYAFLPEEPARGIMLADVRPTQQSEFRTLSNELDELRRDPVGNKAAICAAEEKLCAVVTRLAEESLAATAAIREEHPFLPRRVLGVPLSELPLSDDSSFCRSLRRRLRSVKYSSNRRDVLSAEKEMLQRAEELARTVMAAKREREDANELVRAQNPFLVYDDRKCVPLAVIPLSSDNAYQELYGGHLSALEDAEANAPRLAELEEALRARADELALFKHERDLFVEMFPFITYCNASDWRKELLKDAEFQQLRARREELLRDPVKNAKALREIERAMNARGEAVMRSLRGVDVSDESDAGELFAKNEYDELKEQFKDAYLSARRRSTAYALQGLTVEENVIEVCIESEVVSYNLGRSRNAAKERNRCRRRRGRRSVAKGDFTDDGSLVFDGSVPSSVGTHLIAGDKDNAASRVASPVFVQADGLDRAFDTQSKYADEDRSTPASPLPCDRSASLVDRDAKQSHSRCSPLSKCVSVRASPYDEMLAAARADGGDAVSGKSSPKDENLCNVDTVCAQPADVEVCSGDVGDDLPACVVDDVSDGDATVAKAAADAVDGTCNAQKSSKTLILNVCDLEEEMLDLLNLEALSRSRLSDEERYCRDHILLEGEDEEIVIENTRRFNEKLDLLVADEVGARFCVEEGREEEMCKMKAELSAMLKLQEKISDLLARESEARDIVLCCEKEDFGLIAQLWVTDYNAVLEGEEEREKLRTIEEEAQAREACAVIKSVVFAYRARRRLANRFLSRKVHERKNAIEDLHAAEHTARLAIMEEEGMDHARLLEARDSAAVHILRLGLKPLLELEKEEDNVRHQLIDDCMFDLNNLHRAARKIVARQKEQAPSLLQLLDFEKQDDALRNATSNTGSGENCGSPLPGPHGFCESDEDAEVGEELEENEEDYDNIVESGMYKGYTLDSIGAFLLQYERDLRRMRSFLEKNRNAMVAEHDLLKKSRDNATQDIVHASSGGSLWIPTRPLPLSDLVRGPSAQFRRGYIADARGQRPTLKTTDTDIRTLSSRNSMFVDTFRNTQQL